MSKDKMLVIQGEERNIVAHIYIDKGLYASYSRYVLDFPRLFLFPLYLLGELFERGLFHFCRLETVTYFAGYIVQEDRLTFRTVWHKQPVMTKQTWRNIDRGPFFPSRRKADYTCWSTREGDAVAYIPVSEIGTEERIICRDDFLSMTDQTEEEFRCNEDIKYTGR